MLHSLWLHVCEVVKAAKQGDGDRDATVAVQGGREMTDKMPTLSKSNTHSCWQARGIQTEVCVRQVFWCTHALSTNGNDPGEEETLMHRQEKDNQWRSGTEQTRRNGPQPQGLHKRPALRGSSAARSSHGRHHDRKLSPQTQMTPRCAE
jgi:hypothetical protein